MAKMPIAWHEQCLRNWSANLERKHAEIERLIKEVQRSDDELAFYSRQINAAKARGKDGFDRNRFLVERSA